MVDFSLFLHKLLNYNYIARVARDKDKGNENQNKGYYIATYWKDLKVSRNKICGHLRKGYPPTSIQIKSI